MSDSLSDADVSNDPPPKSLSKGCRRVLGVLIEKGFTTPDQYPLSLKSTTSGANQKNNRDPVTNYSEESIEEALEELRKFSLVATVHTDGGRTERFRHYARKRYPITEAQLAILGELLLRGRQAVGELRARASRMFPIESLDDLRRELKAMMDQGWVQASGPLERRGVEVDHGFYPESEGRTLEYQEGDFEPSEAPAKPAAASVGTPHFAAKSAPSPEVAALEKKVEELQNRVTELEDSLAKVRSSLGV
jgi:uncharacterized protein YceH (UPF0502 family)